MSWETGRHHSQAMPAPRSVSLARALPPQPQQQIQLTHLEVVQRLSVGTQLRPGETRSNRKEGKQSTSKKEREVELRKGVETDVFRLLSGGAGFGDGGPTQLPYLMAGDRGGCSSEKGTCTARTPNGSERTPGMDKDVPVGSPTSSRRKPKFWQLANNLQGWHLPCTNVFLVANWPSALYRAGRRDPGAC